MKINDIEKVLKNLERNMSGYNYGVHFGISILENCEAIDEIKGKLSLKYSDDRFKSLQPKPVNELDLWSDVKYGFKYRVTMQQDLKSVTKRNKNYW